MRATGRGNKIDWLSAEVASLLLMVGVDLPSMSVRLAALPNC